MGGKSQQQAAEPATQYAASEATQQHTQPPGRPMERSVCRAEIRVIPLYIDSGQARNNDCGQQGATGTFFKRTRHLLDGKHDSCQRRIEGRRHPGTASGNNQATLHEMSGKTNQPAQVVEQSRTNLYGGSLAADAGASGQGGTGQQRLAYCQPQGQYAVTRFTLFHAYRGYHLGNATALSTFKVALCQRCHASEGQGRYQQRRPSLAWQSAPWVH